MAGLPGCQPVLRASLTLPRLPCPPEFGQLTSAEALLGYQGMEERKTQGHVSSLSPLTVASLEVVVFPFWLRGLQGSPVPPWFWLQLSSPCLMALVSELPPTVPPRLALVVRCYRHSIFITCGTISWLKYLKWFLSF